MVKETCLCFALCFLFVVPVFLPAQTAAELEMLLENPAITCDQAARFVVASSGSPASIGSPVSADTELPENPFGWVMDKGWLPKNAEPDAPVTLGALSFLMMKAFNIKGGMMYALIPGPRYAYRAMVSRSLIEGTADPDMKVPGERFLIILGNVLSAAGGEQ